MVTPTHGGVDWGGGSGTVSQVRDEVQRVSVVREKSYILCETQEICDVNDVEFIKLST